MHDATGKQPFRSRVHRRRYVLALSLLIEYQRPAGVRLLFFASSPLRLLCRLFSRQARMRRLASRIRQWPMAKAEAEAANTSFHARK